VEVGSWVRGKFEEMQRFRTSIGYEDRLLACLRQRNGLYDPAQLQEIERFGGSKIYARLTANKCRGAASMLREIYVTSERPWSVDPTPVPTLPDDLMADFKENFQAQADMALQQAEMMGQQIPPELIDQKIQEGIDRLLDEQRGQAREQANRATRYIDDLLVEGGFYQAIDQFIEDFVTYPLAIMKGPTAIMKTVIEWQDGAEGKTAQMIRKPVLTWSRVEPADLWWTGGARCVEDAEFIERLPLNRSTWNAMIGLPGYEDAAIRNALREYGEVGLREPEIYGMDSKATLENRNTWAHDSKMIDGLLYTGAVQGYELAELGFDVQDKDVDYLVNVLTIGQWMIKLQVDPDPRQRLPYYIAAYEPVPNSIPGNALPELFADLQQAGNATLRALINNESIASGPQVTINTGALLNSEDAKSLYPWKRWEVQADPLQPNKAPIEFFQPNSNAAELMQVFMMFSNLADEVSAVPRYLTGNERVGGAGRTASGLSMLMQNSSRVMQSVAAGIDTHVVEPAIQKCFDLIMLSTDGTPLQGDETIRARGATHAKAREADKMRLIELFNMVSANPMAAQIIGVPGLQDLLRRICLSLGVDVEHLVGRDGPPVPPPQAMGMQGQQPGSPAGAPPQGGPAPAPGADVAAPVRNAQQVRGGGMGPPRG
jgi:hypothetical protein